MRPTAVTLALLVVCSAVLGGGPVEVDAALPVYRPIDGVSGHIKSNALFGGASLGPADRH